MATKTHAAYGDSTNMIQQAVGLFAAHMQRNGTIAKLTGAMPKGTGGAEATIRKQSSSSMPIVQVQDLSKNKGDEVTFHLVNPVGAKPIMGSRVAEGRGVGIGISEGRLRVNQARFPVDLGDAMTSIRNPWDLRQLGRPIAQSLMDRYIDQSMLVHMSGARGYHNNIDWVVPTDADADFADIMVNDVKAPTRNRHFIATGDGIQPFVSGISSDAMTATSSCVLNMDAVDAVRTTLEQVVMPPPPVIFDGDKAASDSPLRVLLVSPAQYSSFATDTSFRQLQASAIARAAQANQHPLFLGEAGLWNGILIVKMPKPIRFYAGDTIKYCASHTSETESSVTVPTAFGTKFAIDRAILLGGQSVVQAFAASDRSGIPFFWSEVQLDHNDKAELLIGAIRGVSKVRFEIDLGGDGKQFTDYGAMAIDTAVPIIGERQ